MKHLSASLALVALQIFAAPLCATAEGSEPSQNQKQNQKQAQDKLAQGQISLSETYLNAAAENGAARWPYK